MNKAKAKQIVSRWMFPTERSSYMGGIEDQPILVKSKDRTVTDINGKEYLDFQSGQMGAAISHQHPSEFVFPGAQPNRPLSNMAFLQLLKRMKRAGLTAHGFRSTFRDWSAERTNYPNEVAEMALAHAVGDKVEAAYRRGDLFYKRRQIMDAWADHCGTIHKDSANIVVPLKGAS